MLESKGGIWPDHPNVPDDYVHDHASVCPNIVESDPDPDPDPDPSPPVNIPNKNDSGLDMMMVDFDVIPNFHPILWIIQLILNRYNMLAPSAQSRCL